MKVKKDNTILIEALDILRKNCADTEDFLNIIQPLTEYPEIMTYIENLENEECCTLIKEGFDETIDHALKEYPAAVVKTAIEKFYRNDFLP